MTPALTPLCGEQQLPTGRQAADKVCEQLCFNTLDRKSEVIHLTWKQIGSLCCVTSLVFSNNPNKLLHNPPLIRFY